MINKFAVLIMLVCFVLMPKLSYSKDMNFDQHFTLSMLFGVIGETTIHNKEKLTPAMKIFTGAAIGTIPGVIKEIGDGLQDDNYFSSEQIFYDATGSLVGSFIAYKYNSRTKVKVEKSDDGAKVSLLFSY